MDRLTVRDKKGVAYFDDDGTLIRGANGTFHQKKDMTAQYIHDRFVALDKAIDRLAAYEDTKLEPDEIVSVQEEPLCVFYSNRHCNLDGDFCSEGPACPQEMSSEDTVRLLELAKAEKDKRLVVLPDAKYTDSDGEEALRNAMWTCWNTNNPVTRYTADAIAEKLFREATSESQPLTLDELREMDGEPVYMVDLTGGTLWNQWIIFEKSTDYGFIPMGGGWFDAENYGKTWLTYRRKPEEES